MASGSAPRRNGFGALLLPSLTWPELRRVACEADAAGFDAVWIDDHIRHPGRPDAPWLECWTALAGLAHATSRVTIGPLVSNIVLRAPAVLARQALTVAEMCGGRLDVGVGSGYARSDHAALGEAPWAGEERLRRFAGAVAQIRAAIGELPLTVAAHGRGAIQVAAQHADTWVSFGGFGLKPDAVLARTRRRVEMLESLAGGRSIRRRLLCGSAALTRERIWESVDAFDDFVGRYRSIGIDEFAFHWPPAVTNAAVDERAVTEILAHRVATR